VIIREAKNLRSFDKFFEETVHSLNTMGDKINVVDIAKAIDKVLMMTLRLLELR